MAPCQAGALGTTILAVGTASAAAPMAGL
jgi:hypothetical protein